MLTQFSLAHRRYLPKEQNWCVYAEYERMDKKSFWGYEVQVHNYAQEEDGTPHDSGDKICAASADDSDAAKLEVSLCLLPKLTAGPYWVLEYNEAEGYALVSGGQPTIDTGDGCKSGSGTNNSGLWVFTRGQERDDALVEKVRGLAKDQGFDLSVLRDVDQSAC
jgi:lipocalin